MLPSLIIYFVVSVLLFNTFDFATNQSLFLTSQLILFVAYGIFTYKLLCAKCTECIAPKEQFARRFIHASKMQSVSAPYKALTNTKLPIRFALLVCMTLTIVYLIKPTTLSLDIYRYLWDGYLSSNGFNPYNFVPESTVLSELQKNKLYSLLEPSFLGMDTAYPPLAEIFFLIAYKIYEFTGLIGSKVFFALPFFISAYVLYKQVGIRYALIFLLNPLLLFEVTNSGHIDGWMMLYVTLSIVLFLKEKILISFIFLALATLIKIFPLFILPLYLISLFQRKKLKILITGFTTFLFILFAFYAPFLIESNIAVTKYFSFAKDMEYNAGPIWLLNHLFDKSISLNIATILLFVCLMFIYKSGFSLKKSILVGVCVLGFSPVVYPWYCLFITPIVFLTKDKLLIYSLIIMQFVLMGTYIAILEVPNIQAIINIERVTEYLILILLIYFNIYPQIPKNTPAQWTTTLKNK